MLDGCVQALKQMGDATLKQEFNLFADVQTEDENSGDVVAALCKALHIVISMTTGVIKKHNAAHASQGQGVGGAKFGADLKGVNVDVFYRGVTGLVGEPHPGVSSCVCVYCMLHVCVLPGKWQRGGSSRTFF